MPFFSARQPLEEALREAGYSLSSEASGAQNTADMRLALDIDGTITGDPEFFARVCHNVLRSGEVHVVSSRSPEARRETVSELAEMGIEYSVLHLTDPISAAQTHCPHKQLDWFQRHQWLKVDYAPSNGVTHFVDDDHKVLALFSRFAPSIAAIGFEDRRILLQHPLAKGNS